jgi:hypothetical protein
MRTERAGLQDKKWIAMSQGSLAATTAARTALFESRRATGRVRPGHAISAAGKRNDRAGAQH